MGGNFFSTAKGSAVIVGTMCSASFFAGGAMAYYLTKRDLEAKYEILIAEEIAEAKAFYSKLNKKEAFADPTALVGETYPQLVESLQYRSKQPDIVEQSEAFMDSLDAEIGRLEAPEIITEDGFDYKAEVVNRSDDKPYIIHHDEFFEGDKDYPQISLTYFEDDDILVDEKDAPIPDVEGTVGEDTLSRFGHGSKDNNIVYVRNDRLELDFEVIRNKGNYAKEVLGFIEHSEKLGRPRKFRRDYE